LKTRIVQLPGIVDGTTMVDGVRVTGPYTTYDNSVIGVIGLSVPFPFD